MEQAKQSESMPRSTAEPAVPSTAELPGASAGAGKLRGSDKAAVQVTETVQTGGKRRLQFRKMHGIGNDYIFINCFAQKISPEQASALAKKLSRRRFSVGADGLVLIERSEIADARMRIFNADGSEGEICGTALRCVGKYLYEEGLFSGGHLTVETLAGVREMTLEAACGKEAFFRVHMGRVSTAPAALPMLSAAPMIGAPLLVGGTTYHVTCLSIGNPHCVCFVETPALLAQESLDLPRWGPLFEHHACFPARVNTEFVCPMGRREMCMRVWERGSGETYACGSGACAAVAAGVLNGYCDKNQPVTVHLRGGDLEITVSGDFSVWMKGPAETVYDGVIDWEDDNAD